MRDIFVYKSDGTRQCWATEGTTLADAKKELGEIIGDDQIVEAFDINMFVITLCGAPTGRYHVASITESGWATLSAGIIGPLDWQLWLLSDDPNSMKVSDVHLFAGRIDGGPEVPFPLMPKSEAFRDLPVINDGSQKSGLDPAIMDVIRKLTSATGTPTTIKELIGHELRVIRPGDSPHLDLRSRRVNVFVDDNQYIVEINFH